jgi:hypothetical protein
MSKSTSFDISPNAFEVSSETSDALSREAFALFMLSAILVAATDVSSMAVEMESNPSVTETLKALKDSLLILAGDSFGINTKEKIRPAIPKTISSKDIMLMINLLT